MDHPHAPAPTGTPLVAGPRAWSAVRSLVAAAALGLAVLYVVGFAGPHAIHEAAHDARHTLNFPCH
jgi:cobalt transporter subunit CbtB